ncbi:MAG: B12-binding domain-containing radical SAM protein [Planctomycetes bacterium]|nr:B12-binding domain-containing radical SAM protein [Planctomycetota bacterium]MCB9905172.1 B12-binding domain-containing radical SAM protein [Planctomycetota bacterium]
MKALFISEYLPQEMLGPMWLSRAVKDAGHDMQALFLPDKQWVKKLEEIAPDVVLFSATTGMHGYAADVARKVKKVLPNAMTVVGGPHPTFVPEYVEVDGVDAICRGEGEEAIVELMNKLAAGEDYYETQNFWFKKPNGEIVKNCQRPLENDLNKLGFPDRSLIYDAGPIYRQSERKVFVSQRGCPMNCSFCFHHAWKKKVYNAKNREYTRKRTVTHVIDEINEVRAKYPLKFVHFLDDIFNLSNTWLEEFCERYPKEVGLPFDVILMANMTTEKHIEMLKGAGCVYARIALEAASDYVRNAVFRKNTTRQQLTDSAGWIRKHGIRLGTLNMLGGPGGTIEDDWDTVRLNIECKADHPLVSIMQPYPEFDINEMTKDMGYAVSGYDDFPEKFNRTSSIELENKHVIENLHKWFPIVVRYPWLEGIARKAVHYKRLAPLYLVMYMLYSEYMVAEQTELYSRAQGDYSLGKRAQIDFVRRLATKGVMRVYDRIVGRYLERILPGKRQSEMKLKLQMGDERVVAHMD